MAIAVEILSAAEEQRIGIKKSIKKSFYQWFTTTQTNIRYQIAQLWGNSLTQQNVSDGMKKLGITRKKTYGYRERDEEKRKQFIERINQIDQSKIVYVDEAGFDNQDDYPYGYSPKGTRCYAQILHLICKLFVLLRKGLKVKGKRVRN